MNFLNRKGYNRYIAVFFLLFLLSSCGNGCVESDDFGELGDYDILSVFANSNNCSYDVSKPMEDPINGNNNVTITECLTSLKIKNVSSLKFGTTNTSFDTEYISDIESVRIPVADVSSNLENDSSYKEYKGDSEISELSCNIFDPQVNTYEFIYTNISSGLGQRRTVFNECVKSCQQQCSSSYAENDKTIWDRARLKTDNSSSTDLGISLNSKSRVKIKATGSVVLSPNEDSGVAVEFKNISMREKNFESYITKNSNVNLSLTLPNNSITLNGGRVVIIDNDNLKFSEALERIYLNFMQMDTDIYLDQSILVNCPRFKGKPMYFQNNPLYYSIDCDYYKENGDADYFTQVSCKTDYRKVFKNCVVSDENYINSFANKLNVKYSIDLINSKVFDDDFYIYAINGMDFFYHNGDDFLLSQDSVLNVYSDQQAVDLYRIMTKESQSVDLIEGYFWGMEKSFSFDVSKPIKIAIKQITNGNSCKFSVEERVANEINIFPKMSESSFSYVHNVSEWSKNKWQVLKNSFDNTGNEIVFNPYSAGNTVNTATLTFKLDPNQENCGDLFIKIIYLKDYQISDSGYLFFNIPNSGDNFASKELSYTLLNKDVLSIFNDEVGITNEVRYSNFFEFSKDRLSDGFTNKVLLTTDREINDNIDMDEYSRIFDNKAIMVRAGQVIRFDYKNWFKIDGLEKIEFVDDWGYKKDNSFVKIPFGMGLMGMLKKNPLLICIGSGDKLSPIALVCESLENGKIEDIQIGTQPKERCYIPAENNCLVNEENYAFLNNFAYKVDDDKCYYTSNINDTSKIEDYNDKKINNFVAKVYQIYYYMVTNDTYNSKKNCDYFKTQLVDRIYDKTKKCIEYLQSVDKSYRVYVPTLTESKTTERISYNTAGYNEIDINDLANMFSESYVPKAFGRKVSNIELGTATKMATGNVEIDYLGKYASLKNDTTVKKLEVLRDVMNIQIQYIDIIDQISLSNSNAKYTLNPFYSSYFRYYKEDICEIKDEQCLIDNLPYCYDISSYKASLSTLLDNLTNNKENDSRIIEEYGKLMPMDRQANFGAVLISDFAGNKGNMTSFSYGEDKNSKGEIIFTPPSSISFDTNSYLTSYFLNDFTTEKGSNVYEQLKNSIRYQILGKSYLNIDLNSVQKYRNGERLSIFVADNNGEFYGDEAKLKNNGSDTKVFLIEHDPTDASPTPTATSRFKFNEEGTLINKYTLETDFVMSNAIFDPVISNNYNTLFFKIIDTDDKPENNSGNYNVTVRVSSVDGENFLVKLIRKQLFENIMRILDGTRIEFQVDSKGNMITCSNQNQHSKEECYKYDLDNPTDEKVECLAGEENCYRNCVNLDRTAITENSCRLFHDGNGFVKNIFIRLITNPLFNIIVKISFILMLSFYGLYFFLGKADFSYKTLMNKIIRVCFIYFMISESGWNFFDKYFVSMFKVGVDSLLFTIASAFESSLDSDIVRALETGNYSNKIALFSAGLSNIDMLFSHSIMSKLVGLAFSGVFGPIYLYLLLVPILTYCTSVFVSMFIYLTIQIYMSFVLSLFPLVLIFLMFDSTQKSMSNWFNMMLSFVFQEIFLVLTMSFFNALMLNLIKNVFSYRVCWLEIFNIKIGGVVLFQFRYWRIPDIGMFSSIEFVSSNMPSFYNIMFFYMAASLTSKFIPEMTNVGGGLVGGINATGSELVKKTSGALTGGVDKLSGIAKDIGKSYYGRKINDYASRFGLDPTGEKKKKADEKRKNYRDKTLNLKQDAMKDARKKTADYSKTEQFESDLKQRVKDKGLDYETMTDTEKRKEREEFLNKNIQDNYYNSLVDKISGDKDFMEMNGVSNEKYDDPTQKSNIIKTAKDIATGRFFNAKEPENKNKEKAQVIKKIEKNEESNSPSLTDDNTSTRKGIESPTNNEETKNDNQSQQDLQKKTGENEEQTGSEITEEEKIDNIPPKIDNNENE